MHPWSTVYQCLIVREFEANNKILEHFFAPFQVLMKTSIHSAISFQVYSAFGEN